MKLTIHIVSEPDGGQWYILMEYTVIHKRVRVFLNNDDRFLKFNLSRHVHE
jgi:hypothetical protein